jgi:hypothetical protein
LSVLLLLVMVLSVLLLLAMVLSVLLLAMVLSVLFLLAIVLSVLRFTASDRLFSYCSVAILQLFHSENRLFLEVRWWCLFWSIDWLMFKTNFKVFRYIKALCSRCKHAILYSSVTYLIDFISVRSVWDMRMWYYNLLWFYLIFFISRWDLCETWDCDIITFCDFTW